MKDFAAQSLKAALKIVLKQRKMRYEDLASELECSVPTVKRILGNEELTLTRLLEICEVLDLSLSELDTLAKKKEPDRVEYSEAQATFLARNPSHFSYLVKLYSGMSPKQIADKYKLPARSTDRYLLALEKQELIRVTGAQRVKPMYKMLPSLGRGELAQRYFRDFIQKGADFFKVRVAENLATKRDGMVPESFVLNSVKVSKESYAQWCREEAQRMNEFVQIATFEEKTRPEADLMTAVVIEARALVSNEHPALKNLDETLAKIEAI